MSIVLPPSDTVPPNPFAALFTSRKFWLAILDVVVSTALYFVGKYAGAALEDLKFLIVVYQPVVALLIIGLAVEDTVRVQSAAKVHVSAVEAQSNVAQAEAYSGIPDPARAPSEPARNPDRPILPRP